MSVALALRFSVWTFKIIGYILGGLFMLYITAQSLDINIPTILRLVFLVVMVKLEHLLFLICFLCFELRALVVLQVIKAKRRPADPSPRIMSGPPRLTAQEGFPTTPFRALVLHILPKIGPNKIVSGSDIELMQQELRCPISILTVDYAEYSFTTTFKLYSNQVC